MSYNRDMTTLEQLIKERIAASGPITFRDFMEMALYYPGLGYYCQGKDRVGAGGDFYTSPSTHPVFGALLAIQVEQMWQLLGSPAAFTVVEFGAGKGLLARDIQAYLPCLHAGLAASLRYLSVERHCGSVPEVPAAAMPGEITGCILSNELVDALPVHRVIYGG
ncbi:MAG: SAM-dependent methyltransferase, partial [Chloroflexi bacterium]|nr:SAM-dependent methyltransferase [Chloroflexota bacterium]